MSAGEEAPKRRETYRGHCHCGAVQYRVTLSPPLYAPEDDPKAERWTVVHCNCSVCERNGYLLVHPYTDDVTFTKGKDSLSEYFFGNKQKPHWFCKECGSSIGIATVKNEGRERAAMNVRMFKDIDLDTLKIRKGNGRERLQPPYQPAVPIE